MGWKYLPKFLVSGKMRVLFAAKQKYVILGVTGPNEYENNVNNNWYTNRIAAWTMEYTLEVAG